MAIARASAMLSTDLRKREQEIVRHGDCEPTLPANKVLFMRNTHQTSRRKQPKYEEKTFENYFNSELDRRSKVYFPFGQVQEGGIGADAACFSRSRWLWWRLGYPYFIHMPFQGASLREIADEMERYIHTDIRNIPSIKSNLLFQYKRPEFITSKRGSEWAHWGQRYFRYDIYQEQQALLAHIETKFGSKVLVLYASPALEDINDLVSSKIRGDLIENTNFRQASELTGHHRNTYVKAGTHSYACSDPEIIESFDLLAFLDRQRPLEDRATDKLVLSIADGVRQAVSESASYSKAYKALMQPYVEAGMEEYPLFFSILSMIVVREITGIQWVLATGSE